MIRKRLLSACLALALCLGLLPVTALAAGEIELYVAGQRITESGCYANQDGTWTKVDGTEPASGQFYYDADTITLTLNGAEISHNEYVTVGSGASYDGSVIAFSQTADVSLKIELQGDSTITGNGGIRVESTTGNASLSIKGSGSLDVEPKGSNSGITLCSSKNTNLDIDGADVTASSPAQYGVYLISSTDATSTSTITVNNGSLTTGGNGNVGIYYYWSCTSNAGTSSLTVSGNAVVDTRNSQIMAQNKETVVQVGAGSDGNGGIVFNGKSGTVYGDVTLDESLTIGEGETLTIPDDSSLNSNGNLTNNGKIIVDNGGKLEGTINGNQPPKITTERLNDGTVNTTYNQTLVASGDATITWSSSDLPDWLSLNADTGVISGTPTEANTYTFTVTAANAYGSDSKTFTLTVNAAANVPVTGVSLDKTETNLYVGDTAQLTATIKPSTATNQNVTWSSDNESIATVINGVVTAVGSGTAIITVTTVDGNYTAVCTVSVTPYIPPVPSYLIQLPEVKGGTVTADRAAARQGTEVALTVTPDEGFALASLAVTDFSGNQVDISRNSDGTYSFVMPASQVTVSAVFAPAQLPFTDVTEANWYYDEVYYVWANGLMQGTSATTFGPNVDTTRAMVVTILWRLEGEPASGYDMDYSDVAGGAWYAGAVRWATEHGIVNGSEGQFYPGGIVTREQLAAMLYRYAQYKGYDLTAGGDLSGFADAGAVSGWAETSLAWAVGQGLLQGSDSQVDPQGSAIRAQTAAILMRFCENTAN